MIEVNAVSARAAIAAINSDRRRPLVYLASPFSETPIGREAAFRAACMAAADLITAGADVFSPIAHSCAILEHGSVTPDTHERWMQLDINILERCDAMVALALPGWETSKGVSEERIFAIDTGIPVVILDGKLYTAIVAPDAPEPALQAGAEAPSQKATANSFGHEFVEVPEDAIQGFTELLAALGVTGGRFVITIN